MTREEAIEVVKKNYPHVSFSGSQFESALRELVPELAESEDERIRKELIAFFQDDLRGDYWHDLEVGHILAWLEKQKEQKHAVSREEILQQLFQNGSITLSDYLYLTGEQKPAEWKPQSESLEALLYAIEGKWEMIKPTSYLSRRLEDLYEGLVNTFNVDESLVVELPKVASRAYTAEGIEELRELKRKIDASMEPKPAEKQDYSGLSELERAIHRGFLAAGVENVPVGIIKETAQECLAQMKPTEWSEEDEDMLNSCISSIEEAKENRYAYKETDGDTSYDYEIAWLKSLRPHWKPGEEDLDAIKELIDYANKRGWVTPGASRLYEQLKAL